MSEPNDATAATQKWMAVTLGLFILVISWVHIPADFSACNFFDPPKRLGWAAGAFILALLPSSWRSRRNSRDTWATLALMGWMVTRTLLRPNPSTELEVLFTWLLPPLLFLLGQRLDIGGKALRIFGWLLIAGAYLQAALMLFQRFGLDPLFAATTGAMDYAPGRMVGMIGYHNQAVDYLLLGCVGTLWGTSSTRIRLVSIAPLFFTAVLTGNRGGVLAFVAALMMLLGRRTLEVWRTSTSVRNFKCILRMKAAKAALACLLVLMTLFVAFRFSPTLTSRFTMLTEGGWQSPAIQSRMWMGRIALTMIRERPLFGWGVGEYAFQYLDRLGALLPERKTHDILQGVVFAREAHNDPLQFMAEFGAVGFVVLLCFLYFVLQWKPQKGDESSGSDDAIPFILVAMTVSGLFSFPWQTSMAVTLAGLLLGVATSRISPRPVSSTATWPLRLAVTGAASVLFVWFGWDASLNHEVAEWIAKPFSQSQGSEPKIPRWAFRYQALLGASEATQGLDNPALERLLWAQTGYRDVHLWNNLGHVFAQSGRWQDAQEVYRRWAATGIEHANALSNLSVASEQLGDFSEAADVFYSKLRFWPNPKPADVKRLAVLFMRAGDYSQADHVIWRFQRFWATEPPRFVAEMHNLAGSIAWLAGDKDRAESFFTSALLADPELKTAQKNLDIIRNAGKP